MRIISQVRNRALNFFRVASVLLIGAKAQPCCGRCLPDFCAPPPFPPPSPGFPSCTPSYCVQNVVVGSQGSDKDRISCNDEQEDQSCPYPCVPPDYCCQPPRVCCQENPTVIRRILASLQCRRSCVDPCCPSGMRSSFSDPSLAFSSSSSRSYSDPLFSSSGFGSYSDPSAFASSLGSSSALGSILDPGSLSSSSGLLSISDPNSLLSSSGLRSSLLLDPYILSQIGDPSSISSYYDPPSSSGYNYDPCCNPCPNPCIPPPNPCIPPPNPCIPPCRPYIPPPPSPCNPCCRVPRPQPCCKRSQRRVILIDNVNPDSCYV